MLKCLTNKDLTASAFLWDKIFFKRIPALKRVPTDRRRTTGMKISM
jgi:hypothetical protein